MLEVAQAAQLLRFDFVDDQRVQFVQRQLRQFGAAWRGIEHHFFARCVCAFDDAFNRIGFVLQQHPFGCRVAQFGVDLRLAQAVIGTRVEQNAVLALIVHLNQRVTSGGINALNAR